MPPRAHPTYLFDPLGHVRVGRYRLARQWQEQGALYQAIGAYADMLSRYAGTPTAEAAAEALLDLVQPLEQQGIYYTALDVLRTVAASC